MTDLRPRTRRSPSPKGIARHGQLKKGGPLPTLFAIVGASLVVLLVSAGGVASISAMNVANKIKDGAVDIGQPDEALPPAVGAIKGGFNVLIVGSDQCEEWDGCQGPGDRGSGKLNDVTMLLHVSEDQTNAVAISFPRDLIVPIPSCEREDGTGTTAAMAAQQINVTLSDGGLPCTVKTVEELTGLNIQYAGLITFNGVIAMTNAVGGVKVCITGDLDDDYSKIHLKAGSHTLKGADALAFLRSRHGIGDGSDITRISSQQVYLSSLVRKLQSKDTLGNAGTVYKLANAAADNMQLSTSLASLDTMYSMALALKDIPLDSITFVQYPGRLNVPGIYYEKVLPDAAKATQLFDLIKADTPFKLANDGESGGSTVDPNADKDDSSSSNSSSTSTPSPTKTSDTDKVTLDNLGTTADVQTCSVTNN
jgi:LCP family protein required for cell wall assembly